MFVKRLFHGPLGDVNGGSALNDTTCLLLFLKNTWLSFKFSSIFCDLNM